MEIKDLQPQIEELDDSEEMMMVKGGDSNILVKIPTSGGGETTITLEESQFLGAPGYNPTEEELKLSAKFGLQK
ncbi:MAG: hypothetical protein ACYTXI_39005 [Nostoc sp.]